MGPDAQWPRTRAALAELNPVTTAALLPKLLIKGPGLIRKAQELLGQHGFAEDKFKILMIHELERELPQFKDVYEALLADLMAGKPRLPGS